MPKSFGAKLSQAFDSHGQLCVGIDPHAELLADWGLDDTPEGLDYFAKSVIDAAASSVGIVKPQVSFFERFGSAGYVVLESAIQRANESGLLVIADAKRGDIGSTMDAYLDAWLGRRSTLQVDSVTVSPFLGLGTITSSLDTYLERGKSVFALVATSNPEGETVQLAVRDGMTISAALWNQIERLNNVTSNAGDKFGAIGAVIGATLEHARFGLNLDQRAAVKTPILAPGFGAQGAELRDIRRIFGAASKQVIASVSRSVLNAGPAGIANAIAAAKSELSTGLGD